MTPTTYGRDFAYCLKSHGGVRGFNASLWRFLLRCTLFCHSVATFLTSVSSYEGGCGFEVYDDGTFQIGKPEKLPYREIKQYAEEEYAGCFDMAESFLRSGQTANKSNDLKYGSFELHQACERYYKAYMLVYGGTRPKSHKLEVLGPMAKSRSRGFANVFPVNTPEDREAFDKLCRAYIEARYNRLFTVSEEQYEYMLARTEALREVTIRECAARIAYYDKMIEQEENSLI